MRQILTSFFVCVSVLSSSLWPATVLASAKKGVEMPDQITERGQILHLNGLGVRKAFGVVSVYVGGLYLVKTSHDAPGILKSTDLKELTLHFIMDVDKEKITTAWSEGFAKNCKTDCKNFDAEMKTLNGWMSRMQTNEELIFVMNSDSVTVTVNGKEKGTLKKENFPQQFLAIFIGEFPPNKALKEGLLGGD